MQNSLHTSHSYLLEIATKMLIIRAICDINLNKENNQFSIEYSKNFNMTDYIYLNSKSLKTVHF